MLLFTLGIEIFDKVYVQLLPELPEFVKILFVLLLVFNFGFNAW